MRCGARSVAQARRRRPDFAWAMREAADILVRLFHPMMPHLAEECWAALGHKTLVADEPWPEVEPALLVENTITLPVQINGKKRADVTVAARRHKRRDRGCRAGAGCGTTGAGRQAPEKGHRRPAEDRECGGMSTDRRSPASPVWRRAGVGRPRSPAASSRFTASRRSCRRPGPAPALELGRRSSRSGRRAARRRRASRSRCSNDLIFDLTGGAGRAAPTHQLKIKLHDAEPAGHRRHHHGAAGRAAITASTRPTR